MREIVASSLALLSQIAGFDDGGVQHHLARKQLLAQNGQAGEVASMTRAREVGVTPSVDSWNPDLQYGILKE